LHGTDSSRIIKQVVAERFGPARKTVPDMLGSFVHHGLTQEEAESETILQMYGEFLFQVPDYRAKSI